MKNISFFLSENFQFLEEKFSIYLNRRVYVHVMGTIKIVISEAPMRSRDFLWPTCCLF